MSVSRERFVEISYRERKPENITEASTRNLSIEVYVEGRYSRQSTSDLRRDPLRTFVSNAVATTQLLAEDPYRTLPDPKYYSGRRELDLQILDPAYEGHRAEDRHLQRALS